MLLRVEDITSGRVLEDALRQGEVQIMNERGEVIAIANKPGVGLPRLLSFEEVGECVLEKEGRA